MDRWHNYLGGSTSQRVVALKNLVSYVMRTHVFHAIAPKKRTQIVRGSILISCRTAMRGSYPLNNTCFQVNEVFADHDSSIYPIDVLRAWIWNLPRCTVFFGISIPTIFRGLSTESIQYCFWRDMSEWRCYSFHIVSITINIIGYMHRIYQWNIINCEYSAKDDIIFHFHICNDYCSSLVTMTVLLYGILKC